MQQAAIRRDVAAKLWCKDESIKQMCNLKTLTREGAPGMDGACFHAISTEDRGEALAPCGMCDPPVSSAETVCKQCSDVVRQLVTFCQENDKNKLPDFYEVLGVKPYALRKDIRKAWRRLSREIHPDKADKADRAEAQKRFELASQAFNTIVDPDKRKVYDTFGHEIIKNALEYHLSVEAGLIKAASDWYGDVPEIKNLNLRNIDKTIAGKATFIMWYSPWHPFSQRLAPEFRALVSKAGDMKYQFAAANCDNDKLCKEMGYLPQMQEGPVLELYWHTSKDQTKNYKILYRLERKSADDMLGWLKDLQRPRAVELTAENFESEVLDSEIMWMVDFSRGNKTDPCGPCQALKGPIQLTAAMVHGVAKVGIVHCQKKINWEFCKNQQLSYHPYFRLYHRGLDKRTSGVTDILYEPAPPAWYLEQWATHTLAALRYRPDFDEEDFKIKLTEFYETHNPDKIGHVPKLLDLYKGEEKQLWSDLHEKYKLPLKEL